MRLVADTGIFLESCVISDMPKATAKVNKEFFGKVKWAQVDESWEKEICQTRNLVRH